jgi:hypothetical protein
VGHTAKAGKKISTMKMLMKDRAITMFMMSAIPVDPYLSTSRSQCLSQWANLMPIVKLTGGRQRAAAWPE